MVSVDTAVNAVFLGFPFMLIYLFNYARFLKALEREEYEVWKQFGSPRISLFESTMEDNRGHLRSVGFLLRRDYATLSSIAVRESGQRARFWFMASGIMLAVLFPIVLIAILSTGPA